MISGVNITLILFYSAHVKKETYFDPRDLTWKIYFLLREFNGEKITKMDFRKAFSYNPTTNDIISFRNELRLNEDYIDNDNIYKALKWSQM